MMMPYSAVVAPSSARANVRRERVSVDIVRFLWVGRGEGLNGLTTAELVDEHAAADGCSHGNRRTAGFS
jgi:hypothetical protein